MTVGKGHSVSAYFWRANAQLLYAPNASATPLHAAVASTITRWHARRVRFAGVIEKVGLRKRSTTATKNYIVETRQGPAPTNVPSEVQCKDRWYVGSLLDQARHQSGM